MARSESSFFPVLIRVCPLSQIRNPAGGFGTHHCKQSPAEPVQEKVATSPSGHPRTKQPWQSFLPQPRLSHAEGRSPFFPSPGYPMLQRRNEKITRWLVSTCQNSCSGTSQISFQLSVSKFHLVGQCGSLPSAPTCSVYKRDGGPPEPRSNLLIPLSSAENPKMNYILPNCYLDTRNGKSCLVQHSCEGSGKSITGILLLMLTNSRKQGHSISWMKKATKLLQMEHPNLIKPQML